MILFYITIILMDALASAEIDLIVPSFPQLQDIFNLSPFSVELLLGVNLTAHCITALVVGNLGDKFGRKPVIIASLIIFILGSIMCVFASQYWHLLMGRLIQGIGISGPAVLAFVLVIDFYQLEKQQQLMGMLNGVATLVMAFAPVVGSYVNLYFNWQGNFALLLVFGIACLILAKVAVPQGKADNKVQISLREYLPLFKSPQTIYSIIAICFLVQAYWIFIALSPILFMRDLNVPLKEFGFYQGSTAVVFAFFNFTNAYFVKKFGRKVCILMGIISLIIFMFGCLAIINLNVSNPLIITCVMQFAALGIVFPCNILWPLAIETIPEAKARISAALVSFKLILVAIFVQLSSYFYQGNFKSIGIAMCVCILIGFFAIYKLFKNHKILNS